MNRIAIVLIMVSFIVITSCHRTAGPIYQNGVYTGESQSIYTDESYYGITIISIQKGVITNLDFKVLDKAKNEIFDEKYENHFKDIPVYVDQCRKDWQGIQTYPQRYLNVQDINKVDAITGATWSYNLFKASLEVALEKARTK